MLIRLVALFAIMALDSGLIFAGGSGWFGYVPCGGNISSSTVGKKPTTDDYHFLMATSGFIWSESIRGYVKSKGFSVRPMRLNELRDSSGYRRYVALEVEKFRREHRFF